MRYLAKLLKKVVKLSYFRYACAGLAAFLTEYGSFLLLYYIVHLSAVVANTISFILSLLASFLLNKYWVFKQQNRGGRQAARQLVLYSLVALTNVVVTDIAIHYLVAAGVAAFAAKMMLIIAVACWNFFIFKKIVFSAQSTSKS